MRLFLIILPIVLLGATVLTALAAFARSYREAQGYLPLLMFLPMIPSLVLMVAPVRTQLWMLAVPFLGQNQMILRVLRSEQISALDWAVSLGASFAVVACRLVDRGAALSPRTARHLVLTRQRQQLAGPREHRRFSRMKAVAREVAWRNGRRKEVAIGSRPR